MFTDVFIGVSLGIAVVLFQFITERGGIIGLSFFPTVSGAALGAVIGGMQGAMKGADIHMKQLPQ